MDGNLVTIVYTWFICQMITMIWPIKWVSDSANQSMCIIGQRLTLSSWVRESPRLHNILPIHEMARSFTSWSISAARSRVSVQPYKSLIYVTNPPSSRPRGSSGRNTYVIFLVCVNRLSASQSLRFMQDYVSTDVVWVLPIWLVDSDNDISE